MSKVIKELSWKALSEHVSYFVSKRNMQNTNLDTSNFLTHKMNIHLNVLRVLMFNGITCEIHYTYIITIDQCVLRDRTICGYKKKVLSQHD